MKEYKNTLLDEIDVELLKMEIEEHEEAIKVFESGTTFCSEEVCNQMIKELNEKIEKVRNEINLIK